MSSAGCGGIPVCETSVGRTAVLWDLLLLLQTGIGAGNTDNFIYLLLTRQHVTLHSDVVPGAPNVFLRLWHTLETGLLLRGTACLEM